ncbi:cytochrome P450 [Xylaria scruposa]|nr:cytochrome P450 [Xylaria scruposa]
MKPDSQLVTMYTPLSLTVKSLLVTIVAGACSYVLYQCVFSPLAAFPGPLAAKLSKGWRAYVSYRGRWHRDLLDLHQRYGPVVRIGPNELSIGDPDAFLQIYRVNGAYPKSACYSVVQGSRPFDLAGERNEKIHSAQRRLVARAYSMESTLRLEAQLNELITPFLSKLDAVAFSKQIIDIGYWLQLFAFDVIGAVSFSKPYGFVSSGSDSYGSDSNFFSRIASSLASAGWLMHAEGLFKLHQKFVMPLIGNFLAINERNGFFFHFSQREVQTRKEQGGNDKDIAGQLFQVQKNKEELNDLSIAYMMTSNVVAGSDTTSIALRAIFLNLMRHPQVLAKLRAELQGRQTAGKLSTIVTAAEAELCPYLQAVIYEGMRLFSPVGFNMDRDVPAEGMTICGHYVPGGTVVGASPWIIHRATKVWGEDVENFRPERWLDCEDQGYLKRFFFAFGGGTRTCIGRHISWVEIEKLVSTLVMRYDFNLAKDATITEDCGTLVFLKGLRVQVTRLSD